MAITSPNLTPGVLVIGAKYRRWSNLQELTTQPNKQTFPTTRQPGLCSSASTLQLVGRLVQQSDPQPSSDQGSGTCCSGQAYPPLPLVSAMTEPAYCAASGPFFMTMGQENGFPSASGLLSQHYVCALEELDFGAVRTPSPAHQNHVTSILFLWEKQFITRLHNIVHKQWTYSNAYIHFKGKEGWTMPQLQDITD
jgi:hypothetical protein